MDGLLVILAIAVVVAGIVIGMHNGIIKAYNTVKRSWADVHTYERQKVNILESIEPVVQQYAAHESGVLKEIVALRSNILSMNSTEPDVNQLTQVQRQTDELLKGLSIVMENYPDLKANTMFLDLTQNIRIQNENVGAAISIFNRNVAIFNTKIESIPTNIVNGLLSKKQRVNEFQDSVADRNIEYKPNF